MKKIIETDLVSIAHRILQLKDKSDVNSLLNETEKLYQKLVLLKFYEDNKFRLDPSITEDRLNEIADESKNTEIPLVQESIQNKTEEKHKEESIVIEELKEDSNHDEISISEEEPVSEKVNEDEKVTTNDEPVFTPSIEETQKTVEEIDEQIEEIEERDPIEDAKEAVERATLEIDPVFSVSHEQLFVADHEIQENIPVKEETEPVKENQHLTMGGNVSFHQVPLNKTINDAFNNTIVVGLNDRIAFEKNLFNGNSEDLNRVISQLNTLGSYEEAKDFIEDLVKPDFNNWKDKDEYEQRFMQLVEKRFL